jgi:photosystem II stability/assembly factor-like uncharacterized protein
MRAARPLMFALAAGAALAAMAATGATQGWLDVLDAPALKSPLAAKSLLNGLALAGPRVVAVGQRGHILYSDDAGQNWTQAEVPVSSDLVAVTFPTPDSGWAVGHDGVVLHSADAGRSWKRQHDGRPDAAENPLLDVWFRDANTGYAVGAFGQFLRTADAGEHWEVLKDAADNPKNLHLYAIRAVGDDLYIAGEQGLLLKFDRADNRFRALASPYKGTLFGITGNAHAVLAFGLRGNVVRSTDGGATWQPLNTGLPAGLVASTIDARGRIVLASQTGSLLVSQDDGASFVAVKQERPLPAAGALAVGDKLVVAGPRGVQTLTLP